MGLTKPIEQYLFSNLLTKIHVVVYLKDIIRGDDYYENYEFSEVYERGLKQLYSSRVSV